MGSIHPAVSEICVPQSLDPICTKFDKFLGHGQAHLGQMGKWPWRCTTTGLDNSTELRIEKIHQAVTEIWVPQVWQPPARPPTRPAARTVTTIPLQPGGLRGKNGLPYLPKAKEKYESLFHGSENNLLVAFYCSLDCTMNLLHGIQFEMYWWLQQGVLRIFTYIGTCIHIFSSHFYWPLVFVFLMKSRCHYDPMGFNLCMHHLTTG